MEEKRGRKWIGYLIIEVLLVIPILVLLFVMGQFLDREREQQRERLEQSESWEDSQIPVEMAEALSAESMTVTGPSAHAGLYWRSTENAKLWNVPPWTPPML